MSSDLPDYHLPRVVLIDHVELVDLINEITLIKTIENILNIDNITSVDLIDRITKIDEITEISHITGLDELTHITSLDTVGKVWLLKSLAHANVTENLVKNATIDNYYDTDSSTYLIKDWILSNTEAVDTLGGVEGEGYACIYAGGYIKQYLKPNYGDECAFLIWLWGQYAGTPLQVTFTFTDDTTEVFNFTTTAETKTSHLCELTTHKRLKSVTLKNTGAIYQFYIDEVDGVTVPEVVVSTVPDVIIRDANTASQKLAVDANGKITVQATDLDIRTINSTIDSVEVKQQERSNLKAMTEREDLLTKSFDLTAGTTKLLAAQADYYHFIYGWDYEADTDGTNEFSATIGGVACKFGRRVTKGVHALTLVHPIRCDINTDLNFVSAGNTKLRIQYRTTTLV